MRYTYKYSNECEQYVQLLLLFTLFYTQKCTRARTYYGKLRRDIAATADAAACHHLLGRISIVQHKLSVDRSYYMRLRMYDICIHDSVLCTLHHFVLFQINRNNRMNLCVHEVVRTMKKGSEKGRECEETIKSWKNDQSNHNKQLSIEQAVDD